MHVWRDDRDGLETSSDKEAVLGRVSALSHPQVRSLRAQAEQARDPIVIDSLAMVDLPQWSKGRIALLGDAVHCLTLVSGQGAGMAIASAEMLVQALMKHANPLAALASHEVRLRPIIARLQARSHKMAAVFIPQSAFAFWVRNVIMRHAPKSWLGRYFSKSIRSEIELAAPEPLSPL
jgi:2-polyprenyl-6-methoxyphenol hydroxylase-like FAD-dependent oxidoreductase